MRKRDVNPFCGDEVTIELLLEGDRVVVAAGSWTTQIPGLPLQPDTIWLFRRGRPTLFTLLPAVFMLLTTCGALVWQGWGYLTAAEPEAAFAAMNAATSVRKAPCVAVAAIDVSVMP